MFLSIYVLVTSSGPCTCCCYFSVPVQYSVPVPDTDLVTVPIATSVAVTVTFLINFPVSGTDTVFVTVSVPTTVSALFRCCCFGFSFWFLCYVVFPKIAKDKTTEREHFVYDKMCVCFLKEYYIEIISL